MSLRVRPSGGGSIVDIRLHPRSSRPGAAGVREGALELRVSAPPVEGKANEAARKLLSELLGVPPSAVRLEKGSKSRRKAFAVEGLAPAEIRERLEAAANKTYIAASRE